MNKVVFLLFFSVILSGIGEQIGISKLKLIPELFSVAIFALLIPMAAKMQRLNIDIKYILLLVFACLHVLIGLIINAVPPGTIALGSRPYLKWIPIFLIPVIHYFSDSDLKKILRFFLVLLIIQAPMVLLQRLVLFRDSESGDPMTGTLQYGASGALSVLLASGIAILISFYVNGKIKTRTMAIMVFLLFLPTTLNETKITMFLLPVAIIIPLLFAAERHITKQQIINIIGVGLVLVVGYISIYNYYQAQAGRPGFIEFFSDSKQRNYVIGENNLSAKGMLDRTGHPDIIGYPEEQIGEEKTARFEKIRLAFDTLSEHPLLLWTGLGLGNTSTSIASEFSGIYSPLVGNVSGGTILSFLLWETGIGGIALLVIFLLFILNDSISLAKKGGTPGILAAGWIAITLMMFILFPYMNPMFFNALIYSFAFFSGYIASQHFRVRYGLT